MRQDAFRPLLYAHCSSFVSGTCRDRPANVLYRMYQVTTTQHLCNCVPPWQNKGPSSWPPVPVSVIFPELETRKLMKRPCNQDARTHQESLTSNTLPQRRIETSCMGSWKGLLTEGSQHAKRKMRIVMKIRDFAGGTFCFKIPFCSYRNPDLARSVDSDMRYIKLAVAES